jgi:hypothetical protein
MEESVSATIEQHFGDLTIRALIGPSCTSYWIF